MMRIHIHKLILILCFAGCGPAQHSGKKASAYLSKQEIERDLVQLTGIIETRVPLPFYNGPKAAYDSVKNSIRLNLPDSADVKTVYRLFYPLVQTLNDAHFSLHLPDGFFPDSMDYFPLKVIIRGDRLFVRENASSDSSIRKGDEIVSFGTTPVKDIIAGMRACNFQSPGEALFFEKWAEGKFHSRLAALFDFRSPYQITLASGRQCSLQGVPAPQLDPASKGSKAPSYALLDGRIGYLKIPSLAFVTQDDRRQFGEKLDSAFNLFHAHAVKRLILDIRGNMGGSTVLARDVLDYIYVKPYTLGLGEMYLEDGAVKENLNGGLHTPAIRANRFEGKTVLISDVLTYSSAHMMQVGFQHYGMGQTVGEISSGTLLITGEVKNAILRNSGMKFYFGTSNFILPGFEKSERKYYLPDVSLVPALMERMGGEDVLLNSAKSVLSNVPTR